MFLFLPWMCWLLIGIGGRLGQAVQYFPEHRGKLVGGGKLRPYSGKAFSILHL